MQKPLEIHKKKQPAVLFVILVLVIGAVAIWLLTRFIFPMLPGFMELKISAVSVIAVLTIWAVYLIIQQSSNTSPALTIDEEGITDHSNAAIVGFIPWHDITAIKQHSDIFKRQLIVLMVKSPNEYIDRSPTMRSSRQNQDKQFGSPIVIAAGNLQFDPLQLISILKDRAGIEPG